ncbi:MAG: IS1182 family transposase [bacterium]
MEHYVPEGHLLRRLQALLDWRWVRQQTADLYGYNGHVSVDPVVIFKVLLLGYLYNISSIRELMRQIEDRISFRWFIGYDIDEKIPDHSVISKARRRFGAQMFAQFFDQTVRLCYEAGLVDAQLVHVDSTTVEADASLKSVQDTRPGDGFHPHLAPQAYWEALEAEEPLLVNQRKRSSSDPEAGIISRPNSKLLTLCYSDHRVIDDHRGVILVTQATPGHVTDNLQLPALLDELIFHQGIIPQALAADHKYGTLEIYKELENKGIIAHLPRPRSGHCKGKFSKGVFTYLPDEDRYLCPAGERLKPASSSKASSRRYRAAPETCSGCALREQCAAGKSSRTIKRYPHEEYYEAAIQNRDATRYTQARKRRLAVAESSFSHAKRRHAHGRARWRGLLSMQIQCYLVAAVQNLKKLLKYGCQPSLKVAQLGTAGMVNWLLKADLYDLMLWLPIQRLPNKAEITV